MQRIKRMQGKGLVTDQQIANFYLAKARRGRKPEGSGHDRTGCMQCQKHKQGKD